MPITIKSRNDIYYELAFKNAGLNNIPNLRFKFRKLTDFLYHKPVLRDHKQDWYHCGFPKTIQHRKSNQFLMPPPKELYCYRNRDSVSCFSWRIIIALAINVECLLLPKQYFRDSVYICTGTMLIK